MSLADKNVLVYSDEDDTRAIVEAALRPLVKCLVSARNTGEAVLKASNQDFDVFVMRSRKPSIPDPNGLFQWSKAQRKYRDTPWVILGKDIENADIWERQPSLRFLPTHKDGAALIRTLEMLTSTAADGKAATGASPGAGASPKIDVSFLNPVVGAVLETIKSMAQLELTRGVPFIKNPLDKPVTFGDVSGVIAMNSERFLGSFAICFQEKVILKIYENMLGTPLPEINDDIKDCVAELTNIIFGNAKRDLNAMGHSIAPAIPTVITGKNHEIRHNVRGASLCVPFTSTLGKVVVECVVKAPST